MRVLAFDTSSARGVAGVFDDDRCLGLRRGEGRARHGDTLLPLVLGALEDARLDKRELELLVVGLGPGSFTGLRVGVSLAKGLALGLGCPMVGVPSAEALVLGAAPEGGLVASATRAYRGEVYAGLHEVTPADVAPRLPLFAATPDVASQRLLDAARGEAVVCVGDGFELGLTLPADSRVDPDLDTPHAAPLAQLGLARYRRFGAAEPDRILPRYVRGADAKLPARRQRASSQPSSSQPSSSQSSSSQPSSDSSSASSEPSGSSSSR